MQTVFVEENTVWVTSAALALGARVDGLVHVTSPNLVDVLDDSLAEGNWRGFVGGFVIDVCGLRGPWSTCRCGDCG
jgi:hypothetical protein